MTKTAAPLPTASAPTSAPAVPDARPVGLSDPDWADGCLSSCACLEGFMRVLLGEGQCGLPEGSLSYHRSVPPPDRERMGFSISFEAAPVFRLGPRPVALLFTHVQNPNRLVDPCRNPSLAVRGESTLADLVQVSAQSLQLLAADGIPGPDGGTGTCRCQPPTIRAVGHAED